MAPSTRCTTYLAALFLACGGSGGGRRDAAVEDAAVGDAATDAPDAGPTDELGPDRWCPGRPGCERGEGMLLVGAAAVDVTPVIGPMTDIQTVDVDGNGEYDPAEGDAFEDRDGNGVFDGVWIAGFGNARAARGVNNPQWVRVIALRAGDTTIALGSIDCIGYFKDDVDAIRDMVDDQDLDYLAISATHTHEARDTLGIWGVNVGSTGVDPAYMAMLRERAAQAVRIALGALRPAAVQYAAFDLRDAPGGVTRYVGDNRDPFILDDRVTAMRFVEREGGRTIATLVHWGSHPEYTGSHNQELSSDYPHWLREGVTNGAVGPDGTRLPGVGGITVFYQGALGSQIGPNRLDQTRWDGTPVPQETHESAQVLGEQLAWLVLRALGEGGGSVVDETAALGFRTDEFLVKVQNRGYHFAILTEVFHPRALYDYDPDLPISDRNAPSVRTEVAIVDVGRAQILMMPGELDPALFLGGYDGSYTPSNRPIIKPDNPNPPDLAAAPGPPYLRDLMREDAEYRLLFGLGNDMLGYFIPEFDYELHPTLPYIAEAEGDHYEETNSVGIDGWPTIRRHAEFLLRWRPPAP
ncbi:MAG: hypothetical protein NZ898_04545 [Myxococcota bacterium]|nr:hypothetical protein [Myxococcota bacterium]